MQFIEVDLVNTGKGYGGWELHRADCADVAKTAKRFGASTRVLAARTIEQALAEIIDAGLLEMGYDENAVHVFPCTAERGAQ
jgi:hypothetical protein